MSQGMKQIYADNAATSPLSHKAYEAMVPFLIDEYGNASQPYAFARKTKKALREARATIADCIGALPEEIYFTSCGTESNNWVIQCAFRQKMNVVTSAIEHHSVLKPCNLGNTTIVPVNNNGVVLCDDFSKALVMDECGLASVMFANNEIGSIEPIEELADMAHHREWLFHTDAVQAVGHTPINVHELGIDMLSASAHKFNGPKGIGFLYIKKGLVWPSLLLGGSQEFNHRAGTENVASIVGMAVALLENVNSLESNINHISSLESQLLTGLKDANISFKRNGSFNHIAGNLSLSFPNNDGEAILHLLDLQGISISTGSACNSIDTQVSHVLKAIDLEERYAKGTIRISLGKSNTKDEIRSIINALKKICNPKNDTLSPQTTTNSNVFDKPNADE